MQNKGFQGAPRALQIAVKLLVWTLLAASLASGLIGIDLAVLGDSLLGSDFLLVAGLLSVPALIWG